MNQVSYTLKLIKGADLPPVLGRYFNLGIKVAGRMDIKGKQGVWYHFNANGTRKATISYKDGKKHGPEVIFSHGNLTHKTVWDMGTVVEKNKYGYGGLLVSISRRVRGNLYKVTKFRGYQVASEGWMRGGKKQGTWKVFNTDTGVALETCRYVNGLRDGICTLKTGVGVPYARITFEKGLAHGWAYYWDNEGELLEKRRNVRGVVAEATCGDSPEAVRKTVIREAIFWFRNQKELTQAEIECYTS